MTEVTVALPDWPLWAWGAAVYGAGFVVVFMIGARTYDKPKPLYPGAMMTHGLDDGKERVVFAALLWPPVLVALCLILPFIGLWHLARIGKK